MALIMKKEIFIEDLVSIGIPAYNRPERLHLIIKSILGQTYKNIEIIISDDCSPDRSVEKICREFMFEDSRVSYYRQPKNIGPEFNFRFVLDRANGKYFMWAADDDERDLDCISEYLKNIGESGGVFSTYLIRDYKSMRDKEIDIPMLVGLPGSKEDLISFLLSPCPSMIYGLYRTEVARQILPTKLFDFWDFYYCLKVISKYGVKTFRSKPLYYAGIDGKYKLNPFNKKSFKVLNYFIKMIPIVLRAGPIGIMRHIKFILWVINLNKKIKLNDGYLD